MKFIFRSRTRFAAVAILILLAISPVWLYLRFRPVSHLPANDKCIASFDTFTFTFPDLDGPRQAVILPLPPWEAVASVPDVPALPRDERAGKLEVAALRAGAGGLEVWLANLDSDSERGFIYLVYNVETREWEQIPAGLAGSSTLVESIHVAGDGSVWGIGWQAGELVVAVFDDISRRFVASYAQAIPQEWGLNADSHSQNPVAATPTLWAPDDRFWLFVADDAV